MKEKVLFVCIHNSARSQMAEELLRKHGEGRFDVESAGIEAGTINPVVAELLKEEEGVDISGKETKSVFDLFKRGAKYDWVITVCDEGNAGRCPVFPGKCARRHWSFEDPSSFKGGSVEVKERTRKVLHEVKAAIKDFVSGASLIKEIVGGCDGKA